MRLQRFSEEIVPASVLRRTHSGQLAGFLQLGRFKFAVPEKVMPSRAARGYRRDERSSRRRWWLEVKGCQGRSVVGERYKARSAW